MRTDARTEPTRPAGRRRRAFLLCQGRLDLSFDFAHGRVDRAGEVAFEAAEGFAAALALESFAGQVGAGGFVAAALGDCDAVDRTVELAVTGAVEAMPLVLTARGV